MYLFVLSILHFVYLIIVRLFILLFVSFIFRFSYFNHPLFCLFDYSSFIYPLFSFHLFQSFFVFLYLGAVHNIVNIDCKKRSDSERVAFEFNIKKISAYGVENNIIEEIHKFPFPLQQLLIKEARAVMDRVEKGKGAPGLTSLDCHCLFRVRYLLPCKHIFHEHMFGNIKLLTADVWKVFQKMFEECGFEIYEGRESTIEFVQTEKQKGAENRRLTVVELTERIRDRYWSVEEMDDVEKTETFISMLEASLNPIISKFNKSN